MANDLRNNPSTSMNGSDTAVFPQFRHLLFRHHLFRLNPIALNVFTNYFLSGTWLQEILDESDSDDDDDIPGAASYSFQKPKTVRETSIYPAENEFVRKQLEDFVLSSNVRMKIMTLPWANPSIKVDSTVTASTFISMIGNERDALSIAAGVALQYFTRSAHFDFYVRNDWAIGEQKCIFPNFIAPLVLDANASHIFVLVQTLHLFLQSLTVVTTTTVDASESSIDVSKNTVRRSSRRDEIVSFLKDESWVHGMEDTLNHLSVALTVCSADLTAIPCIWHYEFLNTTFQTTFSTTKNANKLMNRSRTDEAEVAYDAMHMVSLLNRASKGNSDLQFQIMAKIAMGCGSTKFGLLSNRPSSSSSSSSVPVINTNSSVNSSINNNSNINMNNTGLNSHDPSPVFVPATASEDRFEKESKRSDMGSVSDGSGGEEYVHLVCLSPVFRSDEDDNENNNNNSNDMLKLHRHRTSKPISHKKSGGSSGSEFLSCFGSCFGGGGGGDGRPSSSSYSTSGKKVYQLQEESYNSVSADRRSTSSSNTMKIVAVHLDMNRADARAEDLRNFCMVSFLLAKLCE